MSGVTKIDEARDKKQHDIKVWQCGYEDCGRQDHRLQASGIVVCNGCNRNSAAVWYPPVPKKGDTIRVPRVKRLRAIGVEGLVCGYCSNITFHMQADETFSCFRCHKPNLVKFYFPGQGVKK
jgi:ribosomal protein L37AE/L43A